MGSKLVVSFATDGPAAAAGIVSIASASTRTCTGIYTIRKMKKRYMYSNDMRSLETFMPPEIFVFPSVRRPANRHRRAPATNLLRCSFACVCTCFSLLPTMSDILDPSDTFATLCTTVGLDVRLRKALSRLGYVRPTLVQSRSLPLAVTSGRDLLVRARTGSGKTLAYCLPLLHKILSLKSGVGTGAVGGEDDDDGDADDHFVRAVVLVPTRELCSQVQKTLTELTYYCDDVISSVVLSAGGGAGSQGKKKESKKELAKQEAMLRDRPDVVVSTPAGLLNHIRSGALVLKKSVQSLVVDEADLVLSYGEWALISNTEDQNLMRRPFVLSFVLTYYMPFLSSLSIR